MKVEIVAPFLYAHGGIRIEEIRVGSVFDGDEDIAVQALSGGWGREVRAIPAAPDNKAAHPPKNKAKG